MNFSFIVMLMVSVVCLAEVKAESLAPTTSSTSSFQDTLKRLKEQHYENSIFNNDYNSPASTWK